MKNIFKLAIFFLTTTFLYAQPTITSFTPTSGAVGTTVTITGTNFNTAVANNIVYFGATKATVTSATATQLVVTVPVGATYQPITILNSATGLLTASAKPFNVTFNDGEISATSMLPKVEFATGTNPHGISIGDIDGDGKSDVVVANYNNSNTISVFRNTSTSGSITGSSFATKVDFATGANPLGISIGDIDGDGKSDVVVTNNYSNTISVFRNTSTSGSITSSSFGAKVDFATRSYPIGVSIGDIDGDGKSDVVVANSGSYTISVYRNTSTTGSITSSSFQAKVDFATGSNPHGVSIGDIDGDGKSDVVVVNYISKTVSVLRNISTTGSITSSSLAPQIDLETWSYNNPIGLSIGDLDGDGKSDVVVANSYSNTVSVLRNKSTSGSITSSLFQAKVEFATGFNTWGISIGDIDGDGKSDLVVTNRDGSTISVLRNKSTSGSITSSSFGAKVDFATGMQPYGVSIGDIDGDGKSDLVVTNRDGSTISVLRNKSTSGSITSSSFGAKVDFATGMQPYGVSIGDIDGDGKSDLVVTNRDGSTISVLRNIGISTFAKNNNLIPTEYSLSQNYPNPFNPSTTISFGIPTESNVKLEIYNSLGQLVKVLVDKKMSAQYYEVKWEVGKISSGMYFYKIIAIDINNPNKNLVQTKKMLLMK